MRKINWVFWVPLAFFAGLTVLFALDLGSHKERPVVSQLVGKALPQFALPAAIEGTQGLSTAHFSDGKPRLLNVFASWCIPCAVEAPKLEALQRQGAEIHAIAIRDKPEDIERFLQRYGNPFTRIGADTMSQTQLALGSSGVPETFVIDGKGVIRYQHIGEIRDDHVPILLEQLRKAEQ